MPEGLRGNKLMVPLMAIRVRIWLGPNAAQLRDVAERQSMLQRTEQDKVQIPRVGL